MAKNKSDVLGVEEAKKQAQGMDEAKRLLEDKPFVQVKPLAQIALLCAKIGEGASVQELRELLPAIFPPEKEEAQTFVTQVQRMKQAAETAHTLAMELLLGAK